VGAVKFNYGDLVTIQINYSKSNTNSVRIGSIGIIIEPAKEHTRGSNVVKVFGSDDEWYLRNNEMDLLEPALTAKR